MSAHKVGFKARSGRHGRNPSVHGNHRKPQTYSRVARLLKARVRDALAPRVEDFDELEVQSTLRQRGRVLVMASQTAPAPLSPARGATHGGKP